MISEKGMDDKMDGNTSNMLIIIMSQLLCSLMQQATAELFLCPFLPEDFFTDAAVASFESNLHLIHQGHQAHQTDAMNLLFFFSRCVKVLHVTKIPSRLLQAALVVLLAVTNSYWGGGKNCLAANASFLPILASEFL